MTLIETQVDDELIAKLFLFGAVGGVRNPDTCAAGNIKKRADEIVRRGGGG